MNKTTPFKGRQNGATSSKVSEGDHQLRLMRWAAKQSLTIPEFERLFHVPNGGLRSGSTAARLKVEGVKAGVPDLCLPVARRGYHGLWIELKTDGGTASPEQKGWLDFLNAQGYFATVAVGADAAYRYIVDYLGISQHPELLTLDREPVRRPSAPFTPAPQTSTGTSQNLTFRGKRD